MNNTTAGRLFRALQTVPTPALVVDMPALERNVEAMSKLVRAAGRSLRPHAKTHKSILVAKKQIGAGAIGICCATVPELQALAGAGISGLLLTAPMQDPAKADTLIGTARKTPITIAVDHPKQIRMLAERIPDDGPHIGVVIDVDVGQRRTGVCEIGEAIAIAETIANQPRFRFEGLQGYAGHVQHIVDATERSREATRVCALLGKYVHALRQSGFDCPIVSGGGTGSYNFDLTHEPFTEIQAGSYVFMDADYARIRNSNGSGLPFECSLFMLTTVTSANRPGQVTVDAGTKSLAVNGPAPHLFIGAPQGTTFHFAGDEHSILSMPEGSEVPALGTRILMSVTHCDPTINLFSAMIAVSSSGDIEKWPVIGRN